MGVGNNQHKDGVMDLYIVRKIWKIEIYNIIITSKEKNNYYIKKELNVKIIGILKNMIETKHWYTKSPNK